MTAAVENWDDDADFQGDLHGFGNSAGTAQTSISSRLSIHSESIAGDEDWNVVLPSHSEQATTRAVQSAKQAGIPLPHNVPASALLGGTIKRLGKKPSKQKVEDDWDNDMDLGNAPLVLKPRAPEIKMTEDDDFDDLEGSLGIRIAGRSKDARDSSISAFSPSMGSITAESELDEMVGLELPEGPMDFDAMLKKRRAAEAELSDLSQASPAMEQTATMKTHKKSKLVADENDDFLNDFDLGGVDTLDVQKRTINKNIRLKSSKPVSQVSRPQTTINFHDKPTDKPLHSRSHLPRPVSGSRPGHMRLESVPERIESFISPPSSVTRDKRSGMTSAQLLRSKRSLPVLSSHTRAGTAPSRPAAFVPTNSNFQPSHASAQRAMPYHLRRDSDTNRQGAQSPPMRSHSRLSNVYVPDTPSRGKARADQAPAALAREAAIKRTVTRPNRRRQFGDGSELEVFDDLPTSQQKEARYVKQPVARGPPKLGLRQAQSARDVREVAKRAGMVTPGPPRTPASPTRGFYDTPQYTPSYLRDTAASRIARESTQSRLAANPRPRSEGPLQPLTTNWKAQVAARSPQASPSSQKHRLRRVPQLIRSNGAHVAKTEKGMIYNPNTLRWEGNENTLSRFELPPALETPTPIGHEGPSYMERTPVMSGSPPRPALIAPMSAATNLQVNGHMVFDPHQMKWLKLKSGRNVGGPLSPSATDEDEDPFANIPDLENEKPVTANLSVSGLASPLSIAAAGVGEMHEEFDLGPQFIRLQKEEEMGWRKRCELWFPGGEARADDGRWRWSIRDIASPEPFL